MYRTHTNPSVCRFARSILSWRGTDGQCLAARHSSFSTLEPDQNLTQPLPRDVAGVKADIPTYRKPNIQNRRGRHLISAPNESLYHTTSLRRDTIMVMALWSGCVRMSVDKIRERGSLVEIPIMTQRSTVRASVQSATIVADVSPSRESPYQDVRDGLCQSLQ